MKNSGPADRRRPSKIRRRLSLSAEARAWRLKILAEHEIDDATGLLLLQTACEAFDRMRQAQALITRDGMTVDDRFNQQKAHPATIIERDSRAAMIQALRALNLDLEPLRDEPGRPPGS